MQKTRRSHTVRDAGEPFAVDPYTRKVTVPQAGRVIGVVGDNCSEKVSFKIPNEIDGHNMPSSTRKYVAWRNVNWEPGTDELMLAEQEEDYSVYTWLVRDITAVAKGLVSFSLHFECDDPETGENIYSWGTRTCTECEILDSVNARLGTYAAVYVAGESLVFADYTPVMDEQLALDTLGIVPEGTREITKNGEYDVGPYSLARVLVPADSPPDIIVKDGGIVEAGNGTPEGTSTLQLDAPVISIWPNGLVLGMAYGMTGQHQITSADDVNLIPEHILKGVNIFGVDGSFDPRPEQVTFTWQVKPSSTGWLNGKVNIVTQYPWIDNENARAALSTTAGDYDSTGSLPLPLGATLYIDANANGTFIDVKTTDLEQVITGISDKFKLYRVTGPAPHFEALTKL